jgi:hypothetical protein
MQLGDAAIQAGADPGLAGSVTVANPNPGAGVATGPIDLPSPVFAAWDSGLYVANEVSDRVKAIISAKLGGNYGLTAPRGSGKSWLLQQATSWANESKGLGLVFPSPSKDKPDAFLGALSEVFAQCYMDYYINEHSRSSTPEGLGRRRLLLIYTVFAVYVGSALIALGVFGERLPRLSGLFYSGLVIVVGSFVIYIYLYSRWRGKPAGTYERAVEFRRQVRFAAVLSNSSQISGGLAQLGASLGFNMSRAASFTERPVTMSSLVHEFREFCINVVAAINGPVVIAIDELDKMESSDDVIELLRAIKGIFDIQGVHYFVSVSDEAARRLELGGIRERNEFNSSFYQVFQLPPADLEIIQKLLRKRKITLDDAAATAVAVLSGGVAREVVRLVDVLMNTSAARHPEDPFSPVFEILCTEVTAFRDEIEGDKDDAITNDDRVFVSSTVGEDTVSLTRFAESDLYRWWGGVTKLSETFQKRYAKDFQRLLGRLMIGRAIVCAKQPLTPKEISLLQAAVVANERDAWLGAIAFGRLPGDLPLSSAGEKPRIPER